jgi:hypothetical protein
MDKTLLIVIMAVASVAMGAWDLLKNRARDVLLTVSLAELALVAGAVLETVFSGGFGVGAIVGVVIGVRGIEHIGTARETVLVKALAAAPDRASSLLLLHDQIDAGRTEERGFKKIGYVLSIVLMTLLGVGLIAMGLTYDVWQALLSGIGTLFLPASQIARAVMAAGERDRIEARIAAVREDTDLLPSQGS